MVAPPAKSIAHYEGHPSIATGGKVGGNSAPLPSAAWIILAGAIVRLGLSALLDPGADEAYAMAVAAQWQLSWFDHPPMVFWWVKAMRTIAEPIFGGPVPVPVLRLPFVLAFTMTSVVMFDLTSRRWGPRAGLWMLLALSLAPFFAVSAGSWMVPDGPLLLFLSLTAWLLDKILFSECSPGRERRLWLTAGLTLGLAGLSKYHAVLFAVGAAAFVLSTPHRQRLMRPAPWLAIVIMALVSSPVFLWNAQHGWVSLRFQMARGLGSGGADWVGLARSVLGQMAYLGPLTLIASLAATTSLLRRDGARFGPAAFLAALALPSVSFFSLVAFWGGDALPHWQMPGWMFLLPLLGHVIASLEGSRRKVYGPARACVFLAAGMLTVAILTVVALRSVPPSPAMIARLGLNHFLQESSTWHGLVEGLTRRGLLPPAGSAANAQNRPLVVAFNWIDASRIAEALGPRVTVLVFGHDPRGFAFLADPSDWSGRDVLLIGRAQLFDRGLRLASPHFERIERQLPVELEIGNGIVFEAELAVGHTFLSNYPLPYPEP